MTNRALLRFGKALREIRKERQWTQLALAEEVGLDIAHISRIERGEKAITLGTVIKIAEALGMKVYFGNYKLTK